MSLEEEKLRRGERRQGVTEGQWQEDDLTQESIVIDCREHFNESQRPVVRATIRAKSCGVHEQRVHLPQESDLEGDVASATMHQFEEEVKEIQMPPLGTHPARRGHLNAVIYEL